MLSILFDQYYNRDLEHSLAPYLKDAQGSVFIKPNLCTHTYGRRNSNKTGDIWSVMTHPALIHAVAQICLNNPKVTKVTVGDNPTIDADWNQIYELQNFKKLEKLGCEITDLRPFVTSQKALYGSQQQTKKQRDAQGVEVILKDESAFHGTTVKNCHGVFDDNIAETQEYHRDGHRYVFSSEIANCDTYISLPKMKTHHKVGVTLNLKGLVGTIAIKNCLVHWTTGKDDHPPEKQLQYRGAWEGNDSAWRMVADLYTAFQKLKPKKIVSIVDGIIAGEGDGPFLPDARELNILIAGDDLLKVDILTALYMGFSLERIKYLKFFLPILGRTQTILASTLRLNFKPPTNWDSLCLH